MKRITALGLILLLLAGCVQGEMTLAPAPSMSQITSRADSPSPSPAAEQTPLPVTEPAFLFRFVIAGDSRGLYADELEEFEGNLGGVNAEVVGRIVKAVSEIEPQPSFMVTLGDYGMGSDNEKEARGQYELWLQIATQYYPASFFYPLYGNHEALLEGERGIRVFGEVFSDFEADEFFEPGVYGRTVYRFDVEGVQFFILNTNSPAQPHRVSDAVLEWMGAHMSDRNNLFFVHEPAFPSGNHVGRSLDRDSAQRNRFWNFVAKAPGAVAFNAHEHQYARRLVDHTFEEEDGLPYENPVYQVTTAGMGAPFHYTYTDDRGMAVEPVYAFHYVICDVYEDRLEFAAIGLDGGELDRFSVPAAQMGKNDAR